MTHFRPLVISLAVLLAGSALTGCATFGRMTTDRLATASLQRADGTRLGTVRIVERGNDLALAIDADGLAPGTHGVHLHTTGRCSPSDFSDAGGHLNPDHRRHGSLSANGPHLGDLPNLEVDAAGRITTELPIAGERTMLRNAIFDRDGTALVIHEAADDYRTDPSGNSGKRIACAVLDRAR